ncbi:hypothetical protein [Methylococcus sp. EFPC2]|nr:hypothetical protein [Methylococcus sp. EFPC2]
MEFLNKIPENRDHPLPPPRVGFLSADFPGRSLIENIIALNRH